MNIAVVILNWNTRSYLERWLPAFESSCDAFNSLPENSSRGWRASVVVADNGSTDGSVEMTNAKFPKIKVLNFDENLGFTGGYNKAVDILTKGSDSPDLIVLANTDLEVDDGWLQPLAEWMDSHPGCGVCGPVLHALEAEYNVYSRTDKFEYAGAAGGYLDRFGYPFCRGRVPGRVERDCGQYPSPENVLWVSGACLMTRTGLWTDLGGLDGRFFAHMEEIDYCWRTALAGYSVTVVPDSVVWHLGGGTLHSDSPFKLKLNFRNNLLLLDNNLARSIGSGRASVRIFTRKALDLAAALFYAISGSTEKFRAVMEAHSEYAKLRRPSSRSHSKTDVAGLTGLCILPLSALLGNNVFKYLRKYENHHRRSR